jgi:predicted MPP superfamily phosphohydrolase
MHLFVIFPVLLIAVLALGVVLIRRMMAEAASSRILAETVALERLPVSLEGLRILYVSDIHSRSLDEDLIRQIEEMGGAELVLIGGDLREKGVPLSRVEDNMRLLRRIAPVYAVFGNHDYDEDIDSLDQLLKRCSVVPLVNRHAWVTAGRRPPFKLAGVDDPRLCKDRLQEALDTPLEQSGMFHNRQSAELPFTILLAHDPIIAHRNPVIPADLILSGHTHGGQIILPLLGPAMRTASVRRFPSGWFELAGPLADGRSKNGPVRVRMLVSPGYGTSKAPIRLNCPPVIHLLSLTRSGQAVPVSGNSMAAGSIKP